ncbi:APEX1 [Enterospora canceri]|uniref:APEX1 n=1 Tax=Enterospora canceri TaxID=1081671 RepID=A0A1Y1S6W1_9MICR|nr:APEX1 [Enterospora canceri]
MKICSFNINGIQSFVKLLDGKTFNEWLLEMDCDICCLQEIKGSRENLSQFFTLKDFCTFATFHRQPGRHGVATFVRKNGHCSESYEVLQGRILRTKHNSTYLYNCYMPFCSVDDCPVEIISEYHKLNEDLKQNESRNVMIVGDLNATYNMIDNYLYQKEYEKLHYVAEWSNDIKYESEIENIEQRNKILEKEKIQVIMEHSKNGKYTEKIKPRRNELPIYYFSVSELYRAFMNKKQRKWLKNMLLDGFVDTFREKNKDIEQYTCWDQVLKNRSVNLGVRIDYILIRCKDAYKIIRAEIRKDVYGSDHCPVTLEVEIDEPKSTERNLLKKKNNILGFIKKKKYS